MTNETMIKTVTAVIVTAVMTSFTDIEQYHVKADIDYLVGGDIMYGYRDSSFLPDVQLTHAEAMTLLTQAFELKSESVKTDAIVLSDNMKWYSAAYTAAVDNDIAIDSTMDPNGMVTREQFASWIIRQLDRIGPYPVVRMYINVADTEQLTHDLAHDVQVLLLTRITSLDENQNFRPQDAITRAEAADWMADAVKFADQIKEAKKAGELEQAASINQNEFIASLKATLKRSDDTSISSNDNSTKPITHG